MVLDLSRAHYRSKMRTNLPSQTVMLSRLKNESGDVLKPLNKWPLAITRYGEIVAYFLRADAYRNLLQDSKLNHQDSGLLNIRAT